MPDSSESDSTTESKLLPGTAIDFSYLREEDQKAYSFSSLLADQEECQEPTLSWLITESVLAQAPIWLVQPIRPYG